MTRPQQYLRLYVKQYLLHRLQRMAAKVPGFVRDENSAGDLMVMQAHELSELRRQMGGSERRELAGLIQKWTGVKGIKTLPPPSQLRSARSLRIKKGGSDARSRVC